MEYGELIRWDTIIPVVGGTGRYDPGEFEIKYNKPASISKLHLAQTCNLVNCNTTFQVGPLDLLAFS
jgi:hypothetical protein